jgi:YbbR domain-containing protein
VKPKNTVWESLLDNGTYKLVALFISLILWVTILGRRDFVYSKNIDIEVQTTPQLAVIEQSHASVRVRVTGPRASLKKFMDAHSNQAILVDVSSLGEGKIEIPISEKKLDLPLGVRVVSLKPQKIDVTVVSRKVFSGDESKTQEKENFKILKEDGAVQK